MFVFICDKIGKNISYISIISSNTPKGIYEIGYNCTINTDQTSHSLQNQMIGADGEAGVGIVYTNTNMVLGIISVPQGITGILFCGLQQNPDGFNIDAYND